MPHQLSGIWNTPCSWHVLSSPTLRRFRHITLVGIRNLEHRFLCDCYFTAASIETPDEPVYTSHIVENTLNPTWELLSSSGPLSSSSKIKICVWKKYPEDSTFDDICIFSKIVDFQTMRRIDIASVKNAPKNTLMLCTRESWYVSEVQFDLIPNAMENVARVRETIYSKTLVMSQAELITNMCVVYQYSLQKQALEVEQATICSELEAKVLDLADVQNKNRDIAQRREKLEELNAMIKEQEEKCFIEEKELASEQAQIEEDMADTLALVELVEQHILAFDLEMSKQETKKNLLSKVKKNIQFRQLKMLTKLHDIYPIISRTQKADHYIVRGLPLPNPITNLVNLDDDEAISSALGYLVHIMILVSKYFQIPLRFRLVYGSSKSWAYDDVWVGSKGRDYRGQPLHGIKFDKDRFIHGIRLLNSDIDQLMVARHIGLAQFDSSLCIAEKMKAFFLHEISFLDK